LVLFLSHQNLVFRPSGGGLSDQLQGVRLYKLLDATDDRVRADADGAGRSAKAHLEQARPEIRPAKHVERHHPALTPQAGESARIHERPVATP
jgi:hypothetical protein